MPLTSVKPTPAGTLTFIKNPILEGKNELQKGDKIKITIAYETRKGNAFGKWDEDDFLLDTSKVTPTGVKKGTLNADENWISFTVENPRTLQIVVTGFDSNYERISKSSKML